MIIILYFKPTIINLKLNMMKMLMNLLIISTFAQVFSQSHYDKILLSDVHVLSFEAGKFTSGRRNTPIQQLECEGEYCINGPYNVMCKNMGRGDKDFVWECTGY